MTTKIICLKARKGRREGLLIRRTIAPSLKHGILFLKIPNHLLEFLSKEYKVFWPMVLVSLTEAPIQREWKICTLSIVFVLSISGVAGLKRRNT
jgi:hypothetical protein